MNLGEIVTRVQRQFGDESGAQITRSDIVNWANDGQLDIVRKTDSLQVHVETDAIKNDGSYDLPSTLIRIRRCTFNGKKLDRIELEALDQLHPDREVSDNNGGTPKYYYVWGSRLWVFPVPGSDGIGNLDVYYVKHPDPIISDQDIPEIPVHMHEDIVRYCLGRAKELDEEDAKAQEVMADYEARITLSRDEANSPENDSYPSVRDIDGGNWW